MQKVSHIVSLATLWADIRWLGFRVFATARRLETVQELQDTLGIEIIQLDVTKAEDIRRVRDEVSLRTGGKLDILVNNAFEHPGLQNHTVIAMC